VSRVFSPRVVLLLAAAGLCIAHFGLPQALRLGSMWESQAHPVQVEVELGGRTVTGRLSHDWDGGLRVRQGDATVMTFRAADPATVTYKPTLAEPIPIGPGWRRVLPFVLVSLLAGCSGLPAIWQVLCRLRVRRRH
jgi:hypothetical protein